MAVTATQLTELYLAYFGRPPDADGLTYYTNHPASTMVTVAAGFSASPESQALYGTQFGADAINSIYRNLFNRDAEPDGRTYWSGEVAAGRITSAGAALAILQGAQNDDKISVQNKLTVATGFTTALNTSAELLGYAGTAAAAAAREFLHRTDWTGASVTTAFTVLDAAVGQAVALGSVTSLNTLSRSTSLADGAVVNLAAGIRKFVAGEGVQFGATATVTGVGVNASVEIAGNYVYGTLNVVQKTNTAADTLNLTLNSSFTDDNDTTADVVVRHSVVVDAAGIESVSITSTGTRSNTVTNPVAGYKADYTCNSIDLTSPDLKSVYVTGDQPLQVRLDAYMNYPVTVDASGFAPTGTFIGVWGNEVAFDIGFFTLRAYLPATIIGSTTGANELWGTGAADTMIGGLKDDHFYSNHGADTLVGGGGNDTYHYDFLEEGGYAIYADTITDFSDGDTIDFSWYQFSTISVGVRADAAEAGAYLQAVNTAGGFDIAAALDSTTGRLYIDTTSDGLWDFQIVLSGVTTVSAADFELLHWPEF